MSLRSQFRIDLVRQRWKIQNFGNDLEFPNDPGVISRVTAALLERYRGCSVTVVYPRPSGLPGLRFIDVPKTGDELIDSYDGTVIDLTRLQ